MRGMPQFLAIMHRLYIMHKSHDAEVVGIDGVGSYLIDLHCILNTA